MDLLLLNITEKMSVFQFINIIIVDMKHQLEKKYYLYSHYKIMRIFL